MLEFSSMKWLTMMVHHPRKRLFLNGWIWYGLDFTPSPVRKQGYIRLADIIDIDVVHSHKIPFISSMLSFIESPAEKAIAVHCVAGLGRAPVLVAIALIEYAHYDPVEAVSFIRKIRRGSINEKQLQYLEQYSRQNKPGCLCVIL
jgi:protein-tyrosine phosphatase